MVSNQPKGIPNRAPPGGAPFPAPAAAKKGNAPRPVKNLPLVPQFPPIASGVAKLSLTRVPSELTAQIPTIVRAVMQAIQQGNIFKAGLLLRTAKMSRAPIFDEISRELHAKCSPAEAQKLRLAEQYIQQKESDFISAATKRGASPTEIIHALDTGSSLRQRYEQIEAATHKAATFEKNDLPGVLSSADILKLARFIEANVEPTKARAQWYFKSKDAQVARDVQVDWNTKEVFLIADEHCSQLQAKGTYKKVGSCALLSLQNRKATGEQAVRLTLHPPGPKRSPAEHLEAVTREFPFYERLKGIPGIAKIRSIAPLVTTYSGTQKPQKTVSVIMNRADKGTLDDAFRTTAFSFDQKLAIAGQLVSTFSQMHERGVIHHDAKAPNVLLDQNNRIVVTDFGLSYFVDNDDTIMVPHTLRNHNLYAAWWYSPFELLEGDKKCHVKTIAQHKCVESFAIGAMLYEMMYGMPGWVGTLMGMAWPVRGELTPALLAGMKKEYTEKVLQRIPPLAAVPEELRTREQHLFWVICNLMNKESDRWTLATARAYMQKCLI